MEPAREVTGPEFVPAMSANAPAVSANADLVRVDDQYLYLVVDNALTIIEAGTGRGVSTTPLSGRARGLLLQGDRAVVFVSHDGRPPPCTQGHSCRFSGDGTSTTVHVLDIADRALPNIVRTVDLSGSLVAAWHTGRVVHAALAEDGTPFVCEKAWPPAFQWCTATEGEMLVELARIEAINARSIRSSIRFPSVTEWGHTTELVNNLFVSPIDDGRAFTTIVSMDPWETFPPVATLTIQSRPAAVFASGNVLYVSVAHDLPPLCSTALPPCPTKREVTHIHKFRLGDTAEDMRYVGSGAVPGHVLNLGSMDESLEHLRVATTSSRPRAPDVHTGVYVLRENRDGNLVRVGSVERLFPGEDVEAVHFDGDLAYVSRRNTESATVLGLRPQTHPTVLGEMRTAGFPCVLRRTDRDHLLVVGRSALRDTSGYSNVFLQLFDVSDPVKPRLLDQESINGFSANMASRIGDSSAIQLTGGRWLTIPINLCEREGTGLFRGWLSFSGVLVYGLDAAGLTYLGGVDHGTPGISCLDLRDGNPVRRAVLADGLIYSITPARMNVQRLDALGTNMAEVDLAP